MFGWSLTWPTGWIDDWHWRMIFVCLITRTYNCIPTWLSKSWTDWNYTWHVSCKSSWIHAWLYLEYQLVWSLYWHSVIPLTIQLGHLFANDLTWHLANKLSFTSKLAGQVSWGLSRISFVLLFLLSLKYLFDSDYWYNFLRLIMIIPPG